MSSVLDLGLSALVASQSGLRTIGHNISNTNTEGYSRQENVYEARVVNSVGSNFSGSGVLQSGIRRVVDNYLFVEFNNATNLKETNEAIYSNARQLDNLLGEESTSLAPMMRNFFEAIQSAAETSPGSIANRQLVLSEAEMLVSRMQAVYETLLDQTEAINLQISSAVETVNSISERLNELNSRIALYANRDDLNKPNDLLDQRDLLVNELSALIDIEVVEVDNGKYNIFSAAGQGLLIGAQPYPISATANETDPSKLDITYQVTDTVNNITSRIRGGELGGLIEFRENVLELVYNRLGLITTTLVASVNDQHRRGMDLNNQLGGDFFVDVNDTTLTRARVKEGLDNPQPSDAVIEVRIEELPELVPADYLLEFSNNDATRYTITRMTDNVVVAQNVLSGVFPSTTEFDGLQVDLVSGTYTAGNVYQLSPFRDMASRMSMSVTDVRNIALAQPIRTEASSSNLGTAGISQGVVLDTESAGFDRSNHTLTPPLMIEFIDDTHYDVLDVTDPANPVNLQPPIVNRQYVVGVLHDVFSEQEEETGTTSDGSAIGQLITATTDNGYPAEQIEFTTVDPDTNVISRQTYTTTLNDTAETTAQALDALTGVQATARNYAEISAISSASPMTLTFNGELLTGTDADALTDSINSNVTLSADGISAKSDGTTITIRANTGVDFTFEVGGAAAGDSVTVTTEDGNSSVVVATAATPRVTYGGKIDVIMDEGVTITGTGGVFSILPNAVSTYRGYQVSIDGEPREGDRFFIEYNTDGHTDNRNAVALANIQAQKIIDGEEQTLNDNYIALVNVIGTQAYEVNIALEASESILRRIEADKESISGVNMDEEAADLIRLEQAYNAAAQLISVARQTFDTLIRAAGG